METESKPLVSVVTPVYNGERYLEECIRSVLNQTYTRFEYLVVNNRSTDTTLSIAKRYERVDGRVQVYDYQEFVDVIESHNRALRLISPLSRYCKVVSADDYLFPDCLARMVDLAEAHPTVGVVSAYNLSGGSSGYRLMFDGLPYGITVVPGREAARWHLLGGRYFMGMPTAVLYRSDLVRRTGRFYPNPRGDADISAFYECLREADLGFVHQVLTYERVHEDREGTKARGFSSTLASHLLDVRQYGPSYLSKEELRHRLNDILRVYYPTLAAGIINLKGKDFWRYHRAILDECGCRHVGLNLARALCMKVADLLLNPKQTVEKILRRLRMERGHGLGAQSWGDWASGMTGSRRTSLSSHHE